MGPVLPCEIDRSESDKTTKYPSFAGGTQQDLDEQQPIHIFAAGKTNLHATAQCERKLDIADWEGCRTARQLLQTPHG